MIGDGKNWTPSGREQRLLWRCQAWSRLLMRWIGCAGVIYSSLIRHDSLATLVFGALGTGMDVGSLTVALFRALRAESHAIDEAVAQQEENSRNGRTD